jgi:prolyl-tRNA editing enzyme YbaK/EbsC (Cys-tRNA(Pro) deacylase)
MNRRNDGKGSATARFARNAKKINKHCSLEESMEKSNSLSPSAQKVQQTLRELGCDSNVIEFADSTRTALEAAERVGCQVGQIVKSLIFRGASSGEAVLVLTSGANRVDENRLGTAAGEPIQRADPEFVRQQTGFAIGGVPPVGHPGPVKTFIDEDLMQYASVWAAAGTPNAVFEVAPALLHKITGGNVVAVKA